MRNLDLHEGVAVLERRAVLVRVFVILFLMTKSFVLLGEILGAAGYVDLNAHDLDFLSMGIELSYLLDFVVFIASVVFVSMWIHRAHANLFGADIDGLEFSPGWSVGWFFVPFANLVKPYEAMRELWRESCEIGLTGAGQAGPLRLWWSTWLGGTVLSNFGACLTDGEGASFGNFLAILATALLLVSAFVLLRIVQEVTRAQSGGLIAANVFA